MSKKDVDLVWFGCALVLGCLIMVAPLGWQDSIRDFSLMMVGAVIFSWGRK